MSQYLTDENISNENLITEIISSSNLPFLQGGLSRLNGGSKSFAFSVNGYVVRFPKAEVIWQSQQQEAQISELLQANLSDKWKSKVTKVSCCEASDYPFAYHKMIKGKICDNIRGETDYNTCFANLSDMQKDLLAADIADFLTELHRIKANIFNPMAENWNFLLKSDFDYEACKFLLAKYTKQQINLDDFVCDIVQDDFVVAHNDMSGSNLAVDETQEHILQGILDFGNAGLMPRINEFFPYYKISRRLARQIISCYNEQNTAKINQQAADYMLLVYCGYFLDLREKQGKEPFQFILSILQNFIQDYKGK